MVDRGKEKWVEENKRLRPQQPDIDLLCVGLMKNPAAFISVRLSSWT